jgi:hypothetical protein
MMVFHRKKGAVRLGRLSRADRKLSSPSAGETEHGHPNAAIVLVRRNP